MSAAALILAACSWAAPGADRYTGTVAAAIDSYADIPASVRFALKDKAARHAFEDRVTITRDAITGTQDYAPGIRDMHFGSKGRVCSTVDRSTWAPQAVEGGLVYCAEGHCILVPAVCGNVARVTRQTRSITSGVNPAPQEAFETLAGVSEAGAVSMPADTPEQAPDSPATAFSASQATQVAPAVIGGLYGPSALSVAPLDPVAPVPEPSTWALLGIGLSAIVAKRWKK